MKINTKIEFVYENSDDAQIIRNALETDNEGYLTSKIDDKCLVYEITSDNLGSFLNTVDDLIACEILAEKIATINKCE